MAPHHTPIRSLLSPLISTFRSLTTASRQSTPLSGLTKTFLHPQNATAAVSPPSASRAFSTSASLAAKESKKVKIDPRITLIRYHMLHPKTPRPLRLSRNRALRHWTIHRAWQLFRRKKLEAEARELERMYESTHEAMEALRNLDAPGTPGAGRLYRIALEKKGLWGHGGVPIEYARLQTDTPGREPWNHGWTR